MEKTFNPLRESHDGCKSLGVWFFFNAIFAVTVRDGSGALSSGRGKQELIICSILVLDYLILPDIRLGKWCWIMEQTVVSWITSRSSHELEIWGGKKGQ